MILKVLGYYRRLLFPTIVPSLRQGERDFPITALVSLLYESPSTTRICYLYD